MNTNLQATRINRLPNLFAVKLLMVTLLGWPLFCGAAAEAQQPSSSDNTANPANRGNRSTSTADSIQALVEQGMLERAEHLAREQLDAAALSSDEAAKAAVALAGVRIANLLRAPLDQQQAHLDAAIEPLQRVLRAYPDHRRAPWLRFQSCSVDIAVAQRQAAVLAATPGDERQRLAVLATLIERSRDLQELEGDVSQQIAVAFDHRDRSPWIDELMALRNAIAVQRVEVLLRRGELFAAGTDDALAAAAEAQQAAIAAQGLVRDDAARQADLLRMRCEALLRMGQPDQAAELLAPLLNPRTDERGDAQNLSVNRQLDDPTLALAVRLALELGQLPQAERLLASHYGERPAEAAAAPESDLARLRYLIARRSQSAGAEQTKRDVGDWIEAIRRRGGDFAQRRAETIVIELLGRSSAQLSDPRIVIAAAAQQLRAGHARQAAERLATAARQTRESAAARQLAVAGAAAYSSVGEDLAAGKLLLEIAQAHQHEPGAAELHLQAAVLLERHGRASAADVSADSAVVDPVNELLRQTIQLWPSEPATQQARRWLVARLIAAEKHVEAATVAAPRDDPAATEERWEAAAAAWSEALATVPLVTADLAVNPAVERLTEQALEQFPADAPAAEHGRRRLSVLFGNPALAATLEPTDRNEPFIDWLLAVRRGDSAGAPPAAAPEMRQRAVQRLVADAIAAPAKRTHLAAAILQLEGDAATLPRAMALVWSNRWREADEVLDRCVQTDTKSEQTAITAATVLSRSSQPDAKRRALERFAAVGATLAQGSTAWHEVRLATLELLSELDQQPEAARLAQYILLTRPPEDPAVKARYQRWSEP